MEFQSLGFRGDGLRKFNVGLFLTIDLCRYSTSIDLL